MSETAVDTSVVVAGLCSWHPDHEIARAALAIRPVAIAHVLAECYSVLTRLPPPRRLGADVVVASLNRAFAEPPRTLPGEHLKPLLERLANSGITGGATYDAVIAATAKGANLALASLDGRARSTYDLVGVEVIWLA